MCYLFFFFFKQKTAYEMRISDWSSDVCSSDLKDGNPLNSEAQIAALFKKDAGIEADKFSGTFNGFVVDAQVRKAEALSRSYGIYSVPTIVVGGKYATGPAMTGGLEQTVDAINFLVDKVRKERGSKKSEVTDMAAGQDSCRAFCCGCRRRDLQRGVEGTR